jgi:hypothetical protein
LGGHRLGRPPPGAPPRANHPKLIFFSETSQGFRLPIWQPRVQWPDDAAPLNAGARWAECSSVEVRAVATFHSPRLKHPLAVVRTANQGSSSIGKTFSFVMRLIVALLLPGWGLAMVLLDLMRACFGGSRPASSCSRLASSFSPEPAHHAVSGRPPPLLILLVPRSDPPLSRRRPRHNGRWSSAGPSRFFATAASAQNVRRLC